MDESKVHINPNPVTEANWFSRLFYCWMNPLFKTGYKRRLNEEDLYNVLPEDTSKLLCGVLQKEWDKELQKTKLGTKPSLFNAIIRCFWKPFSVLGIVLLLEESCKVAQPLLLGGLVRYFMVDGGISTAEAYGYASGVSVLALAIGIVHHPYFYKIQKLGMNIRIAVCSMIYAKSLRLSYTSLGKISNGHIVNLMSNDVNRFDQACMFLHFLWVGPVQALVVLTILWLTLGPTSLSGFALLVLLIPVQSSMGRVFAALRRKVAALTDQRVNLTDEVLTGMRVIKMYCWEGMFQQLITDVRTQEVQRIRKANYIKASLNAPFFASAKLIVYVTFLSYILTGNFITAEKVFVCLAIMNPAVMTLVRRVPLLIQKGGEMMVTISRVQVFVVYALYNPVRLCLTLFVPFAVQFGSEALVTIKRVQDFLLLEEREESTSVIRPLERPKPQDCKVTAYNVCATWAQGNGEPTLTSVNFDVRAGELLAVIGPVGAGKSSLLMALLGELPLSDGSIKLHGTVAYASQQPWVFSASVRQNILFGQKYESARYSKALKAADLNKDLELFESGDKTLVGDRGVSLSGGQKARISLARALYYEADLYLLDDPLSAVDAAVGRHLFDKCINGVLKDKPRILVTHQLQYLKAADKILILQQGKVLGLDTYDNLAKSGIDFASLLEEDEDEVEKPAVAKSITEFPLTIITESMENQTDISRSLDTSYLSRSLDKTLTSPLASHLEETEGLLQGAKSMGHLHTVAEKAKRSHVNGGVDGVRFRGVNKEKPLLHYLLPPSGSTSGLNGDLRVSATRSVENLEGNITGSLMNLKETEDIEPEFIPDKQKEEGRAEGTVKASLYIKFFYAGGGVLGLILLVVTNLLAQGTFILSDWWLSHWSEQEETRQHAILEHDRLLALGYNTSNVTIPEVPTEKYIYIFTAVTASVFVSGLLRALWAFRVMVKASKALHSSMLQAVVRSPILFFDSNPIGRVLNRFSKDMGLVDEILPMTMFDVLQCGLMIIGFVVTAGVINPWVFLPTAPLIVMFIFVRKYYLATSRDIKRLEGTTRSPVFSHMSATLNGLHTVRAYEVSTLFMDEFNTHQDLHTASWYMFLNTSRWFAIRLDLLCALFVSAVALTSVPAKDSLSGGLVGLTLTYAIGLMGLFQWGVRQTAESENQMTSVERIMEYAALSSEAALETPADQAPPSDWPKHGIITGENVSFSYAPGAAKVLKNLRFCIRAQEKVESARTSQTLPPPSPRTELSPPDVGICGRTGAGKSSFITMLFRMSEPEGKILIDGVDICSLGLHDLRQSISIIPQDPVLFSGSVRRNLDPFNQHSDQAMWQALEEVQMKPVIDALGGGLEANITEGGKNFSVGQRQLLCLARAILWHNKILVIDEATANVDQHTDELIQQTIRAKFTHCTVLTIAHRLNTIMDSDRVMVLEAGEIVEFEEPHLLLEKESGTFRHIVEQAGPSEAEKLRQMARMAYSSRHPEEEEEEG